MPLSSLNLQAFVAVARSGSFSRAAKLLHLTQSAVSQRLLNLERELATSLIVRDPAGLRLTAGGHELLRYCQLKDSLEEDVLMALDASRSRLAGTIRIATFSSLTCAIVMPALAPLLNDHPLINIELFTREIGQLSDMLLRSEADLVLTHEPSQRQELVAEEVGCESYVLVTSTRDAARQDVFLDHDPDDQMTTRFLAAQKKGGSRAIRRNFLDDVHALMTGVELGWGRAVMPRHLITGRRGVKVMAGFRPLLVPVYLQYVRQSYYAKLHTATRTALSEGIANLIAKASEAER